MIWLGLDASIRQTISQCRICNSAAPSLLREPLMSPADLVVVDFTGIQSKSHMVYTDQYTGWAEVALMSSGKAKNICHTMRTWFYTYGAPKELSSGGGSLFESQEYYTFLKNWGIWKCTSLAYHPQSSGHAELAIKTAKQILFDNTDNCGHLCQDLAARALLTHLNTPVQDLDMSLVIMFYGQIIKNHLLVLRDKYQTKSSRRK